MFSHASVMRSALLLATLGLFAALLCLIWHWRSPAPHSAALVRERMMELWRRAEAAGYQVTPGDPPVVFLGFYLSRAPLAEPRLLCKAEANLWIDVIWVTHRHQHIGFADEYRRWGHGIAAVGDPGLLAEVEEACRVRD